MPEIKKIEDFSDGCAGQYKNKKLPMKSQWTSALKIDSIS